MEAYRKRGFKRCVVPGCTDTTSKRHTFPKYDAALFHKWIEQVQNPVLSDRSLEQTYRSQLVCDLHFLKSDKVPGTKRGLTRTAFPVLHLPEPQFSSMVLENVQSSLKSHEGSREIANPLAAKMTDALKTILLKSSSTDNKLVQEDTKYI
ncbi:unnamed protein product [Acanthoscelides obtectus]|uniref:THAP-type domain-containing protein n=1 Tax=Acanthoscelides obtectus TaxID=200917 RepID=A0A9P0L4K4_ACAOB|nr:unnamed protein product [Acanthoscelides obtectus]CAK1659954.1 hypothetical protein AOBTE_LOCUS21779 [Acanthoscelides obtectus]